MSVELNARLVENFAGVFLSPMYDNPAPPADFHRECWDLYCSPSPLIAVAAPRGHAKSTALTHNFVLAAVLFRWESHVMVVSATEELAMGQLGDMAKELRENDDLRAEFGVQKFVTDSKGEIIVHCDDGFEFRILARGADQRIRGIKWRGRRPGLIVMDDVEEDEQVLSIDRRKKFGKWVRRALIPMGRKGCRIRWHGTILHQDSMLARVMKSDSWVHRRYRAHTSFSDFTNVLWPAMWDEKGLRAIRQIFIDDQDSAGYAQEYLNDPREDENAYLKKEWFKPMEAKDHDSWKLMGAGVDFAISKKDSANRTSITIGGKDLKNLLHITDQRKGRWDSSEIVDEIFLAHEAHRPDFWWVEDGQIWKAIWPIIRKEMELRGKFLNFFPITPIKDKAARGRALQRRMKALACRFNKEASWYPEYEEECLNFTEDAEASLDDQFDSSALLAFGFENLPETESEDAKTEEEEDMEREDPRRGEGRSSVTGY